MLIRFFRVGMYPTVAAGCPTPTEGDEVMCFVESGVGVAAEPPVVDTVVAVANVFPAAHAPVMVAFQNCGPCLLSRLFTHDVPHTLGPRRAHPKEY